VVRGIVAVVAALAGTLVLVAPVFASGAPSFERSGLEMEVYPTRLYMQEAFNQNHLPTEWQIAYAPAENGHEPAKNSPAWIVTNSGTTTGGEINGTAQILAVGNEVTGFAGGENVLRPLAPSTGYYVRFFVKNAAGEETQFVPFTTLPVGKPEIVRAPLIFSPTPYSSFELGNLLPTSASFTAQLEANGAEITAYHFEYAPFAFGPAFGPWTTCATGSVPAQGFANPVVECSGLTPETEYYVRVRASSAKGEIEQTKSFTTPSLKPVAGESEVRNVGSDSAHLTASLVPQGSRTRWRFESAVSPRGPWTPIAGAAGVVSQAQAESLPFGHSAKVEGSFVGLDPGAVYYVRLFAENECAVDCGEAHNGLGEPVSTEKQGFASFKTSSPPTAATFATHALHGELSRIIGAVDPHSVAATEEQVITVEGAPTAGSFSLTFDGQQTAPIAFDAPAVGEGSVGSALEGLPSAPEVAVYGFPGGPYTVSFYGGNVQGNQPQIEADASGLIPAGNGVSVVTTQQGGVAGDTDYHFEYEPVGGGAPFAAATSTPSTDAGAGDSSDVVAVDLPGLTAGATYRYRLVAGAAAAGSPVDDGGEQTLTVPVPAVVGSGESCANEGVRTGPSANLPDCRAYEQLTPHDKEGAQEPFHYAGYEQSYVLASEDGEHVLLEAPATNWGSGPEAGHSPYFFSRTPAGWGMTAASSEPELGVDQLKSQVFAPDLASFGFETAFETSASAQSKDVEYRVGPPGGPYVTVATVPRQNRGSEGSTFGWVAASAGSSTMILQVADRDLVQPATTTKTGFDLYEYSGGALRQVNVGIGTCGAKIARGGEVAGDGGSAHAVSADGSRVFFEAVPGNNCGAASHLYVRTDGAQTTDLGAAIFLAANEAGSEVLFESISGEAHEVFLYETESATTTHLFTTHGLQLVGNSNTSNLSVSRDLSTIYFASPEQLTPDAPSIPNNKQTAEPPLDVYRYDVASRALEFILQAASSNINNQERLLSVGDVSPDGRYVYMRAEVVEGVPGGARELLVDGTESPVLAPQVYRYDSVEHVVECVSCASSYDPEPRLPSLFSSTEYLATSNGALPSFTPISGNGDFAFFSTPAALVSSDVDREIPPNNSGNAISSGDREDISGDTSPSSDVYEWRRDGIDGCDRVQGCLALITNGRGGLVNLLLGSADEGRDVFIATASSLLAQDNDTAEDIYDARIGGGFPPPAPGPVECEGDACSTPFAAPNDLTPASATFKGAANTTSNAPPATQNKPKTKSGKPKKKRKTKRAKKGKAGSKQGRRSGKAKKSDQRRGK
jgi:hypothetical protein